MEKRNDFKVSLRARRGSWVAALGFLLACSRSSSGTKTAATTRDVRAPEPRVFDHGHGHESAHHHRFDDAAGWSRVFDDPAREAWQMPSRIVEAMALEPAMTVADVGAGTGYFEPYLSRAVGSAGMVIAEDIEPGMVTWLERRAERDNLANIRAVLGTADDPRLAPASVDRILIVDTWHHVRDRPSFAKKLATALRAGGAIFVVDFTLESPHGPPRHARLAPEAVASDLAAAGLRSDVVRDVGLPHQYLVRGKL